MQMLMLRNSAPEYGMLKRVAHECISVGAICTQSKDTIDERERTTIYIQTRRERE